MALDITSKSILECYKIIVTILSPLDSVKELLMWCLGDYDGLSILCTMEGKPAVR